MLQNFNSSKQLLQKQTVICSIPECFECACSMWNLGRLVFYHMLQENTGASYSLYIKVHLTPNTISAKMQTWSCSKSNLTIFRNIWIFFEQQYNLKFDMLCLMTELVKGMGLFLVWRQKLFCMHVHKELMPWKRVCDVKSGIEPDPC